MVRNMKIISDSIYNDYFSDNCGSHGGNCSPAIRIADAPEETASFALLIEDRDAVPVSGGFSWVHWAACNITSRELPEDASRSMAESMVQGLNSYTSPQGGSLPPEDCIGYCGMSPPNDDHIYTIRVYALDRKLDLKNGFPMNMMFRAMRGHVLAQAELDAWYRKA